MTTCLNTHTVAPENYLAWHEWAERKAKTHEQIQCPECGLWAIWKRKATTEMSRPAWEDDPVQRARWRYWVEHDPDALSWPPPRPETRQDAPLLPTTTNPTPGATNHV